jgi:retron-type reverse transcriptase
VIEPILEADFQDNSYGFRPKRSAHQAVDDVRKHLFGGKIEGIEIESHPSLQLKFIDC